MYPLISTKERLAIWEKARGLWKGRVLEQIREPKKITIPIFQNYRSAAILQAPGRSAHGGRRNEKTDRSVWTQRFWDGCARPLKKGLPYRSLVNEILASEMRKAS